MSLSPKVSIIIPNYNHGRFLRKRFESVLNQTFQDFEVIYIDDASTDNSNEVVRKYIDDRRVQFVVNGENTGIPFKQWNKGVQIARGEYVWIAESDDYADDTLLEKLVALLDENQSVGLAYCQSMSVDEDGSIVSLWEPNGVDPGRWGMDFENNGIDECENFMNSVNTIPNVSAVVFRKEVYVKAGYAPENMRLAGDWLTWVKMLLISDIAFTAEPLNFFRRSNQSISVHAFVSSLRVKERYIVSNYILRNVDLDSVVKAGIIQKLFEDWVVFAQSDKWWKLIGQHLEIFYVACKVDKKIIGKIPLLLGGA